MTAQKRTPAKKAAAKKTAAKKAAPKKAVAKKKAPAKRAPARKKAPARQPEYEEYEYETEEEPEPPVRDRRAKDRTEDRWGTWDKRIRDLFIFILGVGVIVNEIWVEADPRLPGLVAGFTLVGIPLALYTDEQRRLRP